ncbi:hypothetical protein ACE14D_27645, partial [Streptomyces sp. Act-28]
LSTHIILRRLGLMCIRDWVAAGTVGSAWGVAAATACGSAVWWLQLRSALREHENSIREVRTP